MSSTTRVDEVYYPESDGKPMGETDEHRDAMIRHIELLQRYYHGQQVYVSGDLLVYYEPGNTRKFVVPDAFVVKGVPPGKRRVYKLWEEGKPPDVVIETTSRKTRHKDTGEKLRLYATLGVKECILFDCLHEYLHPPLQGYRLVHGVYEPVAPDEAKSVVSIELGLSLRDEGGQLEMYRVDTGERLLSHAEWARQQSRRAQQEARRAEQQAQRAEIEARRADEEARARIAAETELARLRQELARRRAE